MNDWDVQVDGVDLVNARDDALARAESCISQMPALARNLAAAERAYKIEKAQRILTLREEGKIPATLMMAVVDGYEDISYLKFKRDCAEAEMDANKEAALLAKKEAAILQEQIAHEWTKPSISF